jgi:hypothetical protein
MSGNTKVYGVDNNENKNTNSGSGYALYRAGGIVIINEIDKTESYINYTIPQQA